MPCSVCLVSQPHGARYKDRLFKNLFFSLKGNSSPYPYPQVLFRPATLSPQQSDDSSDEGSLHIDTDTKPARNAKVKKDGGGSAAGILDLLQASEEVGALEYNPNR